MGQTLTHGVYLPDEGERNCYSGLASNWSILDNSVGTIAEHASQIAGKAPAVHTHVKADITDLFNSANTWTGNNTYSANCIIYNSDNSGSVATLRLRNSKAEVLSTGNTTSDQSITFRDKNDVAISYIRGAVQSNGVALKIGAAARNSSNNTVNTELQLLAFSNGNKAIFPSTTEAYDLGTSSYQWNNVYSKGYYYNGTPWGLDKLNRWSQSQELRLAALDDYTLPSSEVATEIFTWWGTNNFRGGFGHQYYTNGDEGCRFLLSSKDANNTDHLSAFRFKLNRAGTDSYFYGTGAQNFHLGTSTNKWKTLNGINPGALSLPNYDDTTYIDISGSIVPPSGETEINKNLGHNEYTPPVDGWLSIRCDGATFLQIYRNSYNCPGITSCDPSGGKLVVTLPVRKNVTYTIRIKTSGTTNIYQLYPCLGNV